jgi:uncharacterized small protein (DUF1192 family)
MVEDDDLPRRPGSKPPDLTRWSVDELKAYIQRLQAEIERAKAEIATKQSVRGAAEALFRRG